MDHRARATLRDVARCAEVSVGSVSRYLNNDPSLSGTLSEKIKQAITELHFTPNSMARQLAKGRSNTLLLYVIHEYPVTSTTWLYELPIIQTIDSYLRETDFTMQVALNSYQDSDGCQQFIKKSIDSHSIDGILIVSAWDIEPTTINFMTDARFPFALIGNKNPLGAFNEIRFDNKLAVYELVGRLRQGGHKKIAFFGGFPQQQHCIERYQGFLEALEIHDLTFNEQWIKFGDFSAESGYNFCKDLLTLPGSMLPTAIICGNDYIAAGVIKAKNDHLNAPSFTVTGFDNTIVSKIVTPPITTVDIPIAEMGEKAAKILLSNIQNGLCHFESQILQCKIIDNKMSFYCY